MHKNRTNNWLNALRLVVLLSLSFALLCCGPHVKINLISNKTKYEPDEPIKMQIRVYNSRADIFGQEKPVIANHGFFYQDFYSRIYILDPNGVPVEKKYSRSAIDPAPPYYKDGTFRVPVEIIPPGAENIYFIEDVRKYYNLTNSYGWYKAVVKAPLETFYSFEKSPTGEPHAELLSSCNRQSNPLYSNTIRFEIVPPESLLKLTLKAHVYQQADSSPQEMHPVENAMVRLYKLSQISHESQPIDRERYTYLWNHYDPHASGLTHASGIATFSGIEQGDYLILVRRPSSTGGLTSGTLITKDDAQWQTENAIESYLSVAP